VPSLAEIHDYYLIDGDLAYVRYAATKQS